MRRMIDMGLQLLLGLIFFVFGLNGFLEFLPMPEMGETAGAFFGGMAATGYFLPVLKTVEVVCGLLLIVRLFAPLALVVLAPVIVQILLFHLFVDTSGLPMAIVITLIEAYLGFVVYRESFAPVLRARP